MILEIYQVGKLPPLTVVECDQWVFDYEKAPRIKCYKGNSIIAMFFADNIAGIKEKAGEG